MAVSLHGVLPPSVAEQQLIDIEIHQSPQIHGNSRKAVQPQPDEARLLRSHRNPDQGAVPVMPSKKIIPGGFEIINALGSAPKSNAPPLVSGANNRLELRPAYGDNLTNTDYNEYPSKRRKIVDLQSPPEVEEISPPHFDPREAENYRITRSEQNQGTSREKENRRTPSHTHNSRISTSVDQAVSVSEFEIVEKMMKTSKNSNRARKPIRLDQSQTLIEADPLHMATGNEQQMGKHVTRSNYRGTARPTAQSPSGPTSSKIGLNGLHENGTRSPYFIKRSHCQQQSADLHAPQDVPSIKRQRKASNQDGTLGRSQSPNKGFPPHGADLSGDELQGATTVGSNAGSHPTPPPNISYQVKGAEVRSAQEIASIIAPGLPPSIIPSSFNKIKSPNKFSDIQAAKSGEKERRWSIDLNYANAGKKVEGDALGLVFDERTESYLVYSNGHNLATTDLGYLVQPKKLQRVLFRDAQVRFESSKTQHAADYVLDICSNSERDIARLMERLNNSGIRVHPCENLDRRFAHRLAEQGKQVYCIDDTTEEPRQTWDLISTPCQLNSTKSERQKDGIGIKQRWLLRDNLESSSETLAQSKCRKTLGTRSELVALANAKSRGAAKEPPIRKVLSNPLNPYIPSGFESEVGDIHQTSPLTGDSSASPNLSIDEHSLASAWHSRPLVFSKSIHVEWKDLLEARDLERLEDGEYLNDNLIEFYLKYLKNQLEQSSPEMAKKVYFFNTFFFASLTRKGKRGINYDAVQKWTRSIDIFSYDYVVVPICESQHWYVAIICNLPSLFKDRGIGETLSEDEPLQAPQADNFPDQCVGLPAGSPDQRLGQTRALSVGELVSLVKEIDTPIEQYPSKFEDLSLERCCEKSPEVEIEPSAAQITNGNCEFGTYDQSLPGAQVTKQVVQTPMHKETDSMLVELGEKVIRGGCNLKAHTDKKKKRRPPLTGPRIDPNIPLIITFDSLGLAHPQTNKALKDYLAAEGKAKLAIELITSQIKGITAKQIPHQKNYYDCGLFLLGYIAKFLEGPKDFISRVIGQNYADEDWATLIPSNLRAKIRAQIRTLLPDQERKDQDITAKADWRHSQQRQGNEESSSPHTAHPEATPLQAKHTEHVSRTVITPTRSPQKELLPLEESLIQAGLYQTNGQAREPSPPRDPAQPEMKASHIPFVLEEHLHDAISPIQNITPGKDRFLENALPVHETKTWQPSAVEMDHSTQRREAQLLQDSPDPLHDPVISVRGDSLTPRLESSTPQPQEGSPIGTETHSSSWNLTEDCEQYSKYFPNDTQAPIERPTIIQDSQPTSVVDPLESQEVHRELTPQRKRSTRSAPILVEID